MNSNNTCHMCQHEGETQKHIQEKCQAIHPNDVLTTPKEGLFIEDTYTSKTHSK